MAKKSGKTSNKKKSSDDTFTYILIGLIIIGIGYYYYYYIYNGDYDPAQIGGTSEVIGTIPEDDTDDTDDTDETSSPIITRPNEPPKPIEKPKPVWLFKDGARNMIVLGETPIASSAYGAAPAKLNQRAAHNMDYCIKSCKSLSANVAAISPLRAMTLPSCQCYKVQNKVKLAADMYSISKIAYLSNVTEEISNDCSNPAACAPQRSSQTSVVTKTCNTAASMNMYGYHQYHATDSLINNTLIHIWFDTGTKKLMYKRRNNELDTGSLVYGTPAGVSFGTQYTVFKNSMRLTANFRLGLVYSGTPPIGHKSNNASYSRARINGIWYDWQSIIQCAVLRDARTGKITNMDIDEYSFYTDKHKDVRVADRKMTESPDEMVMFEHNTKYYVFINRMAIESSVDNLSAIPIYPQITYNQAHGDPSLFHYGTLKIEQVINWVDSSTRDVWLLVHAPSGTMQGHTFKPDSNTMYTYYVKNTATPDNCLSCQIRERDVCPDNTILIGCGFGQQGRCGTCYMSSTEHGMATRNDNIDDSPCGNCQIGRLMVKTNTGKIWTDANRRILKNAVPSHKNINDIFEGPFVNDDKGRSGKYSIEDGMKNAQLYRRIVKAARDTGRTNPTAQPAYCNIATGSIKQDNDTNTQMATGSNTWKQFKNFAYISTLNAESYGPAICQLGTSAPNKFDGGFCTIGYADVHLNNFALDAARQQFPSYGDGSNGDNAGCIASLDRDHARGKYRHYTQNAAKNMDVTVKWTLVPRLMFPHSSPPIYNPYIGIQFLQLTLTVKIYNKAYTDGAVEITENQFAEFNKGDKNYMFKFTDPGKAQNFTNTKLIVMPPYSDIRVGFNQLYRVVHNVNVDFLDFIPSLSGFSSGCVVTDVTPANMMEDKKKYTPDDKEQTYVKSNIVKSVPNSTCDKNNCMQFDTINHHIAPYKTRTIRGKPSFTRCYNLKSGPCRDHGHYVAWHLPRIVAECRVMGAKPGDAFIEHDSGCTHEGTHPVRTDCGPVNGSTKDYRVWEGIIEEKPPKITGNYNGYSGSMKSKDVDNGCHPNDCMISTKHGQVAIQHLNIGDHVYTPSGYEPIIGFFDKNNNKTAGYYEIALENNEIITVSRHHAIPIDGTLTDPSLIKSGDIVNTLHGMTTVTSNTMISKQGAHHFIVPSGLYYIDNVVCSDYTMHVPLIVFNIVHMYILARYHMGIPIIYREQSVLSPYWPYHILGKMNASTTTYNVCSIIFVPIIIVTEFILSIYVNLCKK